MIRRESRIRRASGNGYGEPVWAVELVSRADGAPEGLLIIGMDTGSNYGWHAVSPGLLDDAGNHALQPSAFGSTTAPGAEKRVP